MLGLVPSIHVLRRRWRADISGWDRAAAAKTWMVGTGPTMTVAAPSPVLRHDRPLRRRGSPRKLIPACTNRPYPRLTSPRGAAIRRHAAWRGGGGALRPGLHPGLGRLRGTALGVLRPLCEELAGRLGISRARCGTDDEAMSRTGPWNASGMRSPSPISAARGFQIAGKRSATGRAEGGSILPRRILAQWKRPDTPAPRGAPLPLTDQRTRRRGRTRMHARTSPSCSPLWRAPTS